MHRLIAAAVVSAVTAATLPFLGSPAVAAGVTVTDGCIRSIPDPGTTAPVEICFTLFRPAGATRKDPVPMVLHSHGWGGSRTTDPASFSYLTDAGFGVLSFDQRGFGESGGQAYIENPDVEGKDVKKIVDLVAAKRWVEKERPGDPVLGAIGGSYGGGYQFVGAFTELRDRGATRFDALAPEITWFNLKEALAPDEVARSTWLTLLTAAGSEALPQEVVAAYAYGASTGQWPGAGNPIADLDAFFEKNGPAWHVAQGRTLDIPVLFGQGAPDNLFNLNQGLKNFAQALTPAARAESIFVGYNGGHVLPNVLPAAYAGSGDPCAQKLGGGSFSQLAQRFFQEKLKGVATGLTGYGAYHLATTEDVCVTVDSVEPTTSVELGTVPTTTAAGGPLTFELGAGPMRLAGQPMVDALVTSVGVENRAFFALSVGTSPADARVVANNVMPLSEPLPVVGEARSFELPAMAVDVPEGSKLFLTVSPVSDMFFSHGSRTPGALVLESTVVRLPVVAG